MKDFKFQVFTDADGVLFDFDAHFTKTHGKPFNSFHYEWCWEQINADPDFFYNLPLMPGANEYWNSIKEYNPQVITGCPREPYFQQAAGAKRKNVSQHFGTHTPVITCMSRDKAST